MSATKVVSSGRMVALTGLGLFIVGAAGDIAHHALPRRLARELEPLLGVDGERAHLATLLGMLAIVLGLLWKGARGIYDNHHR